MSSGRARSPWLPHSSAQELISALRTWHEVKSAQLVSERDLERERRMAVEADFERANRLLPHLEQSTTLAAKQLADLQKAYEDLLATKGSHGDPLDRELLPIVTRLLLRAIVLELVQHNLLRGQAMGKELMLKEYGKENRKALQSPDDVSVELGAAGFLLIMPELFGDQPQQVLKAAKDLAALTSAPDEMLRLAGSSLASRQDVVEHMLFAKKSGSPVPITEEYLLRHVPQK